MTNLPCLMPALSLRKRGERAVIGVWRVQDPGVVNTRRHAARTRGRAERAVTICGFGFSSAGKAYIIDLIMKYFECVLAPV